MKRVLILTVGGSPQPVVNAIDQNGGVDYVYFICSIGPAGSDKTIDEVTTDRSKGKCPHCDRNIETSVEPIARRTRLTSGTYEIRPLADPDDLASIHACCASIAQDITARFGPDVEVIANYTGGTKTMSLGLGTYAMHLPGWVLQVNATGRRDLVRITSGDVATRQDTSLIRAQIAVEMAERLRERHDYDGAVAVLMGVTANFSLGRERLAELRGFIAECQLLAERDRLDLSAALQSAESPHLPTDVARKTRDELRRFLALKRFFGGEEDWKAPHLTGVELVKELLSNARRRADSAHYEDAVARLYRATELLGQACLLRCYGISTSDVNLEALPGEAREWVASRAGSGKKRAQLGMFDAYGLLYRLQHPLGIYANANQGELKYLSEKRNYSLLAHGLTPVDRTTWNDVGTRWLAWLEGAIEHGTAPPPTVA